MVVAVDVVPKNMTDLHTIDATALLRLMQLSSPSLPVGGFTYSQGLEWAVEQQWVADKPQLQAWLAEQIHSTLVYVDFPVLLRLHAAAEKNDWQAFSTGRSCWSPAAKPVKSGKKNTTEEEPCADCLISWGWSMIRSKNRP